MSEIQMWLIIPQNYSIIAKVSRKRRDIGVKWTQNKKDEKKELWTKDRRRDGCGGDAIFFVFFWFSTKKKKMEWDEKSFYNNEK